jgi:hypothetical protein
MKIRFYGHKTVGWGFNQITIWPGVCFVVSTMNPDSTMMILGANILIWDLGIIATWQK